MGTTRFGVVGLAAAVLTLAAVFFFDFPVTCLGAAVVLGSGFWRPGLLPGGGHYRLLRNLCDRLRRGIRIGVGGWSGGLDDTPSSDDLVSPLAQFHLLGRGTGLLSFR